MRDLQLNRRDAIASLLAFSAAGSLAACNRIEDEPDLVSGLDYAGPLRFFREDEMALIGAVADTIIPTTDTPGAVAAGVPATIQGLASEWADDGFRLFWREGLEGLADALGGNFAALSEAEQLSVLSDHDAGVYAKEGGEDFYRSLKSTVATAYYMSEPGATQELAYEPVPGEWIGDAPISEYPKTWAT